MLLRRHMTPHFIIMLNYLCNPLRNACWFNDARSSQITPTVSTVALSVVLPLKLTRNMQSEGVPLTVMISGITLYAVLRLC